MNNEEPILPQLQGKTMMIPSDLHALVCNDLKDCYDKPKLYLRDILSKSWNELDKQQIFDQVAEHLFTQSRKATYAGIEEYRPRCAYRGANNCVCAIGSLIPDCEYNSDMESNSVGSLIEKFYSSFHPEFKLINFLQKLQSTHDSYEIFNWKHRLMIIANESDPPLNHDVLNKWNFDKEQEKYIKDEAAL
jgi:hypothetical protein